MLEDPLFWRAVMAVLAPLSFWYGFRCWKRARLILDLPTSRVRSAAQGYVEMQGRAKLTSGTAMSSPLNRLPCVWWSYSIQEKRRSGRNTRWVTINQGCSVTPFLLEDDSGWCVVNPLGAEVFPENTRTWYGALPWPATAPSQPDRPFLAVAGLGEYRYSERWISEYEWLDIMGLFRTIGGAGSLDREAAIARLLAEWKQDMTALTRRFDDNRDGVLSQHEWERARAAARAAIAQRALQEHRDSYALLCKPDDDRPFLLASGDLAKLARRYNWQAAAAWLLFVVLCGVLTQQLTR